MNITLKKRSANQSGYFANDVPVCRIVIETVTKALKRIKLFFFGIYIKKITKKFHFPKEFLQEYSIG